MVKGRPRIGSSNGKEPMWRRILMALLSALLLAVILLIAYMMFLLYSDGPR